MATSSNASSSTLSSTSFSEFNDKVQAAALSATRSAAGLPTDLAFHRSMDSEFAEDLDAFSAQVLSLTNNLLSLVTTADPSQSNRRKGKAKLQNQDDVVDDFHSLIVDSMDQLLERTDICLDEFLGRTKAPLVAINYDAPGLRKTVKKITTPGGQLDPGIQHASNLAKPQLAFKHPINNSDEPWYPALSHKYNAQVPLGHIYRDSDADAIVNHPYRYEITHIAYPPRMFVPVNPITPTPFESTSATWVATPDALDAMIDALRQAPEVAVDLEHNSYRSYAGIVCLMQVSTRTQDWIVDTLALRAELATAGLNEVFTDPNIVKVFHGAESDIVWLQQDFNLYIVNLFDTFHASKLLDFPRHGLANLLEMYCDFVPDKRYQLADWRIRPLPADMLAYARSDTHFLLFIYDNLRNALLDRAVSSRPASPAPVPSGTPPAQALLRQALGRSEETALRTYEREPYDAARGTGPGGWDTLARKWNKGALVAAAETPNGTETMQRAVYRCLHTWRDAVAREEDESARYVLPNHYLFQLAERPPADMVALLQTFPSVPPVVRRRAKELLEAIRACLQRVLTKAPKAVPVPPRADAKDAVMEVDSVVVGEVPAAGLWSLAPGSSTRVAGTSVLFGGALSSKKAVPAAALAATTSTLFGTKGKASSNLAVRFQEVVARIHSALVISPSMPIAGAATDVPPQPTDVPEAAQGMQAEVPYVPAAQRSTKREAPVVDDTIAVVGQARQKKRKRAKVDVDNGDGEADDTSSLVKPAKKERRTPEVAVEGEMFDFTAVPNILDDVPNGEDMRVKKKKKQRKRRPMYGDFPAPPRAHSDVKSGNRSHTFK
ncbi:ribonuclease H-like domain-containing protein [Mycena belliarum]|uniref:Ribonuclease H-like domain-containing protein n=1 Tax=Mycena belliarum TaxID=1033014 RepID=A0AAD6XPF8_9AGAR|nr:ribonuclease H-like domain-containing protein [Mycena belliae]